MAENTGIAWATHTHNEWEGCTKVGRGCDHCYAEARNRRFHGGVNWGVGAPRRLTSIQNRNRPLRWQRERRAAIDAGLHPPRVRVFGGSLMDPFDNEVLPRFREGLWARIDATPDLDWILVTKRIGNVWKMAPAGGFGSNVIILATIVDQLEAERDLYKLRALKNNGYVDQIGVSYEPALGPVDWSPWIADLDWLIIGGESAQGGAAARDFRPEWAWQSLALCRKAGVPFYMKQMGSRVIERNDHVCTGIVRSDWEPFIDIGTVEHDVHGFGEDHQGADCRIRLGSRAGSDPSEWPLGLRIREFPRAWS